MFFEYRTSVPKGGKRPARVGRMQSAPQVTTLHTHSVEVPVWNKTYPHSAAEIACRKWSSSAVTASPRPLISATLSASATATPPRGGLLWERVPLVMPTTPRSPSLNASATSCGTSPSPLGTHSGSDWSLATTATSPEKSEKPHVTRTKQEEEVARVQSKLEEIVAAGSATAKPAPSAPESGEQMSPRSSTNPDQSEECPATTTLLPADLSLLSRGLGLGSGSRTSQKRSSSHSPCRSQICDVGTGAVTGSRRRAHSANRVAARRVASPAPAGGNATSSSQRWGHGPSRTGRAHSPYGQSCQNRVARFVRVSPFCSLEFDALEGAYEKGVAAAYGSDNLRMLKSLTNRKESQNHEWLKTTLTQQVESYLKELKAEEAWQSEEARREYVLQQHRLSTEKNLEEKRVSNESRHARTAEHRAEMHQRMAVEQHAKMMQELAKIERLEKRRAAMQEEAHQASERQEQRRRETYEEALRLMEEKKRALATRALMKVAKSDTLESERRSLYSIGRSTNAQSSRTMEQVAEALHKQRVTSKYDADQFQELMDELVANISPSLIPTEIQGC